MDFKQIMNGVKSNEELLKCCEILDDTDLSPEERKEFEEILNRKCQEFSPYKPLGDTTKLYGKWLVFYILSILNEEQRNEAMARVKR